MDNFCVEKSTDVTVNGDSKEAKESSMDTDDVKESDNDSDDGERARSLAETMKSRRKALLEDKEIRKEQEKLEREQWKKEEKQLAKIQNREAIERKYWVSLLFIHFPTVDC